MTTNKFRGVTAGDRDVYVTIEVQGTDEHTVEKVAHHTRDEAVRAMQALSEGVHPDDAAGSGIRLDWETIADNGDSEQ